MMTTDKNEWTPGLTLVDNLLHHVIATYPIDKNRTYGSGQSQGGMANIAISDKHPDLFTAQFPRSMPMEYGGNESIKG